MLDDAALAAQLRRPHGDAAQVVAESMNRSNGALNHAAIALVAVSTGERVLEVGPGNAAFAPLLLQHPDARYLGVELSDEMVLAGNALLVQAGLAGQAKVVAGDIHHLPVADASIDAALTVNTLYFWPALPPVLREFARVLRPGGRLCLAFGDAHFMRSLPFTAHGFHLHERDEVAMALQAAGFIDAEWHSHRETGLSNNGLQVDKHFHLLLARRR